MPDPGAQAQPPHPLLAARAVSKVFPGIKALDEVDFELRAGEVHALMGENGAGKSTLIKVLTGVYQADGGAILLNGNKIRPRNTLDAQNLGISTVYQEVNLIPYLTVAENICLGRQKKRLGFLRWGAMRKRAEHALASLGVSIDVRRPLFSYSIALQQLVAIARAVDLSAKVLILDEPTSSLDKDEVAQLFQIMTRLKEQGLGIIFVTHFLEQVYAISDRITVLRNGRFVCVKPAAEMPRLKLVSQMIGRDATAIETRDAPEKNEAVPASTPFISARDLGRKGAIHDLNFDIAPGEVLGLAGLLGSGRTETARLLFGIDRPTAGALQIDRQNRQRLTPRQALSLSFGYCSEDRKTEGIIPNLSIRENIILALQARDGLFHPISLKEQNRLAEEYIAALKIATTDQEKPIKFLSGGNQQKVLLARWLASKPRFLILDEPTRGIDVGAKFEILNLVKDLVRRGLAILFISSELEETVRGSSRVIVLRDGKQAGELKGAEVSAGAIMEFIAKKGTES